MLHDLTLHLEWADAEVWSTVLEHADVPLDSKLEFWLHHMHTTQHAFVRIWRDEGLDLPQAADFSDPPSLARWCREGHGFFRSELANADPVELQRELDLPWAESLEARFGGPVGPVTLEQSALQVILHTAHHRGQITARLRELGLEPPLIDFLAWILKGKPSPKWPVEL